MHGREGGGREGGGRAEDGPSLAVSSLLRDRLPDSAIRKKKKEEEKSP